VGHEMAAGEHATEAAVMRAHRLQLLPTVAVESETSMTTNFFQGKWAILDTDNNNYLSGDSGGIAAVTKSITPAGTFILYATTTEPGFVGLFMGYVQLQGNMQYIGVGNCSKGFFNTREGVCCGCADHHLSHSITL